ncbi:hypothetical protein DFS34DRAFT_634963 [Phlyctochytrium arcticum]|nr:hypothetical protein DFS34DRAFT_634963 [Phlyctochytrium arcticum]
MSTAFCLHRSFLSHAKFEQKDRTAGLTKHITDEQLQERVDYLNKKAGRKVGPTYRWGLPGVIVFVALIVLAFFGPDNCSQSDSNSRYEVDWSSGRTSSSEATPRATPVAPTGTSSPVFATRTRGSAAPTETDLPASTPVPATSNSPVANNGQNQNVPAPQAPTQQPAQQPAQQPPQQSAQQPAQRPSPQAPPKKDCPPMGDETGCPKMGEEGWFECVSKKSDEWAKCHGIGSRGLSNIFAAIPQSDPLEVNLQVNTQLSRLHRRGCGTPLTRMNYIIPTFIVFVLVGMSGAGYAYLELQSSRTATKEAIEELNKIDAPAGLCWRDAQRKKTTITTRKKGNHTSTHKSTTSYPGAYLEVIEDYIPIVVQIEPPQQYAAH